MPLKDIKASSFLVGVVFGIVSSLAVSSFATYVSQEWQRRYLQANKDDSIPQQIDVQRNEVRDGVTGLVGNTPIIRIKSLSDLTGVDILGKAEFMNPGGSVKDRVALQVIRKAEQDGLLHPHTGSCIFEGTVGSTGISMATMARATGYEAAIIMPDDVAAEKAQILEKLGARVEKVRPVSIVHREHYVNLARSKALAFGTTLIGPAEPKEKGPKSPRQTRSDMVVTMDGAQDNLPSQSWDALEHRPRGFFADQFENLANFQAHYTSTGPEIWHQTAGNIDAFVAGAGTGGTIAGVARFLKHVEPRIRIVLSDPQGSGLYNKIKSGVMYSSLEAEGTRRRHQVDTVVEGIGINRVTKNFAQAEGMIDDAIQVSDAEALAMSRHLVLHDGLFLGSSSAVNLVACVKLAKKMKAGQVIATILCDSGSRHYSKFWSDSYLEDAGIPVSSDISHLL